MRKSIASTLISHVPILQLILFLYNINNNNCNHTHTTVLRGNYRRNVIDVISFVIAALVNATISNPTCLTNLPSVKSFLTGNWIEKAKHFEGPGCLHYCFFIFFIILLLQSVSNSKHK